MSRLGCLASLNSRGDLLVSGEMYHRTPKPLCVAARPTARLASHRRASPGIPHHARSRRV